MCSCLFSTMASFNELNKQIKKTQRVQAVTKQKQIIIKKQADFTYKFPKSFRFLTGGNEKHLPIVNMIFSTINKDCR